MEDACRNALNRGKDGVKQTQISLAKQQCDPPLKKLGYQIVKGGHLTFLRDGKDLHANTDPPKSTQKSSKPKGAVCGKRCDGGVDPRGDLKSSEK